MAINVSQSFHRTSANAVDDTLTLTKAEMKTVNDNLMPSKYLTVCQDDGYIYLYDKTNTVDTTTGKFRKFEGGSQVDTTKLYSTDDTAETTLADGDYFPFQDVSASGKRKTLWSNVKSNLKTYFDTLYNKYTLPTATSSTLGGVKIGENMTISDGVINPSYLVVANKFNKSDLYSTTEKVVGCDTDGRPIYQKTITDTMPTCATDGTYVDKYISVGARVLNYISLKCIARDSSGYEFELSFLSKTQQLLSNNQLIAVRVQGLDNATSSNANTLRISNSGLAFNSYSVCATLQYTKTTDSANSFKYADENDYSTSEKIVGTWIDGSILYQRTFSLGALPNSTYKDISTGLSNINVVKLWGFTKYSTGALMLPLPLGYPAADAGIGLSSRDSGATIRVITGQDRTAWTTTYATLQYTKN